MFQGKLKVFEILKCTITAGFEMHNQIRRKVQNQHFGGQVAFLHLEEGPQGVSWQPDVVCTKSSTQFNNSKKRFKMMPLLANLVHQTNFKDCETSQEYQRYVAKFFFKVSNYSKVV